jgi:phage-related minor tail protein
MATGLEMMLKSMGIDVGKAITDFEELKKGVTNTLTSIDTRLASIEKRQEEIWQKLQQQTQPLPVHLVQAQPNQPQV